VTPDGVAAMSRAAELLTMELALKAALHCQDAGRTVIQVTC